MYTTLIQALQENDNFAVISHFRPDGDAIGSPLAMGLLLQALGKKVQMWNADPGSCLTGIFHRLRIVVQTCLRQRAEIIPAGIALLSSLAMAPELLA